jgi:ribosomal protein S18 acetylase RimI-like enzyme
MGERDEVRIRHARYGDLAALSKIWMELMQMHQTNDARFTLASEPLARWRSLAEDMLSRQDGFVLAAERDASLVGFCLGWVAYNPPIYELREVGFISELAVAKSAQRRGVGTALVDAAAAWFRDRGLEEFQLSTAVWNEPARAFWRRLGGEELLVRYRFALPPGKMSGR